MQGNVDPRIILISQWPKIKNAEFELIEKIRETKFEIIVVDYLGFDIETGRCVNTATLYQEYDFAIALHFETPKFLNIRTFYWVANPLAYMHLNSHYRDWILPSLRSFDGYLYNGSDLIKNQIESLSSCTEMAQKINYYFYQSCSKRVIANPELNVVPKIFYCGINWERCLDEQGRSSGLLTLLDSQKNIDFYGPRFFEGAETWSGFSSYVDEIPFDGVTLLNTMKKYRAVLAISSPAHLNSRTSSGRVFEGIAAGVPIISDDNPHVRLLFGDDVYYFSGETDQEKATSIQLLLQKIILNPAEALERVKLAQQKIVNTYCFEKSFLGLKNLLERASLKEKEESHEEYGLFFDVFLFDHSPYTPAESGISFSNISNLLEAMNAAVQSVENLSFRLFFYDPLGLIKLALSHIKVFDRVSFIALGSTSNLGSYPVDLSNWSQLKIAEKVRRLSLLSSGDFSVFLTQNDFVQYDYFLKPLSWFKYNSRSSLYVAGFFESNLLEKAPEKAIWTLRNNHPVGLYLWGRDSPRQHELSQFIFTRENLNALDFDQLNCFDVLFSISLVLQALAKKINIYRSPYFLVRITHSYFKIYFDLYSFYVKNNNYWARNYYLLSCHEHEYNVLYDKFFFNPELVEIINKVAGKNVDLVSSDFAIYRINKIIEKIMPIYKAYKRLRSHFALKRFHFFLGSIFRIGIRFFRRN